MQEASGFPGAFPDIIPQVLPSSQVHGISGAPGAGKTVLTAWIFQRIREGLDVFGYETRSPASLGFITADRPAVDHKQWYEKVGLVDIAHYSLLDDTGFNDSDFDSPRKRLEILKRCLDKLNPPPDSLINVDPLALFLGGDLNKYDIVASHLFRLTRLCMERQIVLWGNFHAGKQKGDVAQRYTRPQDRVAGTTAIAGFMGTTMHLAPPTETGEAWHEFTWTPHHAPSMTVRLRQDPESGLFSPVSEDEPTQDENEAAQALEAVLQLFPEDGSYVSSTQLLQNAKLTYRFGRDKTRKLLKRLADEGMIRPGLVYGEWGRVVPS